MPSELIIHQPMSCPAGHCFLINFQYQDSWTIPVPPIYYKVTVSEGPFLFKYFLIVLSNQGDRTDTTVIARISFSHVDHEVYDRVYIVHSFHSIPFSKNSVNMISLLATIFCLSLGKFFYGIVIPKSVLVQYI